MNISASQCRFPISFILNRLLQNFKTTKRFKTIENYSFWSFVNKNSKWDKKFSRLLGVKITLLRHQSLYTIWFTRKKNVIFNFKPHSSLLYLFKILTCNSHLNSHSLLNRSRNSQNKRIPTSTKYKLESGDFKVGIFSEIFLEK